ncbi:hypothetical protein K438DRAFT_2097057 [Mycena galopus ATCC 62051]|nr:hypothetical protein K438DRAFT_2097057 [Mycena galopus ATCC 62051]
MEVGSSTVVVLLQEPESSIEETLTRIETVMKLMTSREVPTWRVLSTRLPESFRLFSASPGLLTADFNALETPVRSIAAQCPDLYDIQSLTREEVAQLAIFSKLVDIWRECLGYIRLQDDDPIPSNILLVWAHLFQAKAAVLQDGDNPDADTADFATEATSILIDILLDSNIDVTLKAGEEILKIYYWLWSGVRGWIIGSDVPSVLRMHSVKQDVLEHILNLKLQNNEIIQFVRQISPKNRPRSCYDISS